MKGFSEGQSGHFVISEPGKFWNFTSRRFIMNYYKNTNMLLIKGVTPSVIRPLDHRVYPTAEPLSHESLTPSGFEKHAFSSFAVPNTASPGGPRWREAEHQCRGGGGG